jgi:hypothetical protein
VLLRGKEAGSVAEGGRTQDCVVEAKFDGKGTQKRSRKRKDAPGFPERT